MWNDSVLGIDLCLGFLSGSSTSLSWVYFLNDDACILDCWRIVAGCEYFLQRLADRGGLPECLVDTGHQFNSIEETIRFTHFKFK